MSVCVFGHVSFSFCKNYFGLRICQNLYLCFIWINRGCSVTGNAVQSLLFLADLKEVTLSLSD